MAKIFFFFQAEDGIRDYKVTGVQTCALPISLLRRAEFLREKWRGPRQSPRARDAPAVRGRPKRPPNPAKGSQDAPLRSASGKAFRRRAAAHRSNPSPAHSRAAASLRAFPPRSAPRPPRTHASAPDSLAVAAPAPPKCAPKQVFRILY